MHTLTSTRHSTPSGAQREKTKTSKPFSFEEMLSELEAIVADASLKLAEEERA
ncbi:hypothetical protein KXR87_08130 [Yokenella regensburgei]|uniref:hypothetical protein n=1 Tax=Yokenella regensburgei TaxID=158877 RepID=UPI003F17E7E5